MTCRLSVITIINNLDLDDLRQLVKEINCYKVADCDAWGETIEFELVKETAMVKSMK